MRLFFLACSFSRRIFISSPTKRSDALFLFPFPFLSYFLLHYFTPSSLPLVHTPSSFSFSLSSLFLTPHRHPLTSERKGIQTTKKSKPSLVQTQLPLFQFHNHHLTRYACLSFFSLLFNTLSLSMKTHRTIRINKSNARLPFLWIPTHN